MHKSSSSSSSSALSMHLTSASNCVPCYNYLAFYKIHSTSSFISSHCKAPKITMGEKKNENKKGDGEKKEKGYLTVILTVEGLCEGCAFKIVKYIRNLEGVEDVKADINSNKVTLNGVVDPIDIKEKLEKKTKKKVSLVSPQPKKENKKEEKEEKKPDKEKKSGSDNKPDKNPKQAPVTTADLKVQLKCQCQGCIDKIRKIKGVHGLKLDQQKELVTVKGTMDAKALAEALKEKLKKNVEVVTPKKEKDGNSEGGDGKNKKKKGGDSGNETNTGGGGMEAMVQPNFGYNLPGYMPPGYPGHGHPGYMYGYGGHGYPGYTHPHGYAYPGYVPGYPVFATHPPHHMFNDENPNACTIL